ncbi:DUF3105 domain-containing protein [Rhodococcus sp. BP-252]|uniref:DUF3105 domain-containing protein n=1 Tax=Rhodococcoides kyotonense TaxID=398843 RepID=A0A177YAJ9_9NOCA|nr:MULTISPECIES: DUF3105 domain-containing protein [Rhodococcus]MBY6414006.1 DUF3105 domain-containing protein [Rhodococcus sp. BP-320]MBY6418761.1 DUF3105 domain-containing protein [Rhodococcus sp. BP-321]MBY6423358.1 DUF3105 domain-containing protein [Rhodococcus sp. BP-324]MBY6428796.1 DUF3105 domain-containing protein [Rhodococcus sp. BP-323]MBY6433802.1 DUF3105 domain-containing protein [Rhodococcus sp. BP-322]
MPTGSDSGGQSKKSAAKANKAIKAAKRKSGVPATKSGRPGRQIPWLTVGAIVVVVGLIAILAINLVPKYQQRAETQKWEPSESNQDPSSQIADVVKMEYPAALHVSPTQRVAYDQTPPFGGPHDAVWATCTGVVYPEAIRTENAVHSLEHGAVWITYNPDELGEDQISTLADKVDGESYMLMSPYPGQDSAVSLQSWGHQLKLDSVDDERIDHFIAALRLNRYAYPEVGASCSTVPGSFDPDNPPPFDASAPGADAVPMDGAGITPDASETGATGGLPDGMQLPSDLQLPTEAPAEPAPAS